MSFVLGDGNLQNPIRNIFAKELMVQKSCILGTKCYKVRNYPRALNNIAIY